MLGELLTRLLGRAGVDEVVNLLSDAAEQPEQPGALDFDAVVTTIALPDSVHADIVLSLPGGDANRGTATLRTRGQAHEEVVDIDGLTAILRLLDERLPGDRRRADAASA